MASSQFSNQFIDQLQIEQEARLIFTELRAAESQFDKYILLKDEWISCIRSLKQPYRFFRELNEDVFYGRI